MSIIPSGLPYQPFVSLIGTSRTYSDPLCCEGFLPPSIGTTNFPPLKAILFGKSVRGTPNFPAPYTNSIRKERRGSPKFPRYFGILGTKLLAPIGTREPVISHGVWGNSGFPPLSPPSPMLACPHTPPAHKNSETPNFLCSLGKGSATKEVKKGSRFYMERGVVWIDAT